MHIRDAVDLLHVCPGMAAFAGTGLKCLKGSDSRSHQFTPSGWKSDIIRFTEQRLRQLSVPFLCGIIPLCYSASCHCDKICKIQYKGGQVSLGL